MEDSDQQRAVHHWVTLLLSHLKCEHLPNSWIPQGLPRCPSSPSHRDSSWMEKMYCSPLGSMELSTTLRKEGSPRLGLGLWDPQATTPSSSSSSTGDEGDSHAVPPFLNMVAGSESWPETLPLCFYKPVLTGVPAWHSSCVTSQSLNGLVIL